MAGLTTSDKPDSQIHFVTEAEASVHFCMHYTSLKSCLEPEINFAVCDAGGSTVDTTLYTVSSAHPKLQLNEKCASACIQAGAIFVDHRAELYLRQHFEMAGLPAEKVDEFVAAGIHDFKYREKLRFSGVTTELRLKVAGSKLKDESIGIRSGSLKVPGSVVQAHIFDPYVKDIVDSVNSQVSISTESVSYLLLVGGFGNNPYLIQQLKTSFESSGCRVTTPNEATSKAVADGAIIWHCANSVVKRAPRLAYGVEKSTEFDPNNLDHGLRKRVVSADYRIGVNGQWSQIVPKGISVDCDSFVRRSYVRFFWTSSPNLGDMTDEIFAYSGEDVPDWVKTPSESLEPGFHNVCTVVTDLSGMRGMLQQRRGKYGDPYWVLRYDICIRFGRTELEAFLEWTEEQGDTKKGRARIVPIPELELL
ncbi:unnamed protein product [Rhizoctonia solani]|uniref:Actin-like ATPase domain-containing protein n=1 Tax=Rhizoctonia solani TaxID=456999 RepID=A0A8H3H665_9AGAM|nr:unnamed protein product [Rhizoctonia solani]